MSRGPLPEAHRSRLRELRVRFREGGATAMLITDMTNLRYLSGFTGTEAALLVTRGSQYLLADFRYVQQAEQECPGFTMVKVKKRFEDLAGFIRKKGISGLAFEKEGMTHGTYLKLKKLLKGVKLVPAGDWVLEQRSRKADPEVRLIKRSANIAARAFREVWEQARAGMKEREFALVLETRMQELGSGYPPFSTIVASGKRGAYPHGVASDKKLRKGELVTVDFGAAYKGYQSDQTITFCLGSPDRKQRRVYETVREAQTRAIKSIRPGVPCRDVDGAAREYIKEAGYGDYFGHGLGHGVGLSTHELPVLNPSSEGVLESGMVVTVEPGIYIPGWGGVRIEDMVLVTGQGRRVLTSSGGELRVL
ncbi:MAG: aminopeptidase P family protein [bacterium]